jgi:prepilin signal peptidase PulO-like enzyme (type II secretory pathway)
MGDVKLLGAIGVYLGLYVIMVLFVASLVGAVWGVASKQVASLRSRVPFGPFIALATVVVLAWGQPAWRWYASLVGLA